MVKVPLRDCKRAVGRAIAQGSLPRAFENYVNKLCEGAVRGRDLEAFKTLDEWIAWLSWASVSLNENDYLLAAIHALRLAPKLAATDYGTSRQRDLGQLWTDTIRGFLGEIAFAKWLKQRFGIFIELDYRRGPLREFLPSDIRAVEIRGMKRAPRINISIKTTKLRGVWLDIPYEQIQHSDAFILVRLGITREHFVAFLKKISAIRDKILAKARELGIISEDEIPEIWNSVPEFMEIPAYIAGFLLKEEFKDAVKSKDIVVAEGKAKPRKRRGRRYLVITIDKYLGFWEPGNSIYEGRIQKLFESQIEPYKSLPVKIEFQSIGEFSETLHFLASSGVLKRHQNEWSMLISLL